MNFEEWYKTMPGLRMSEKAIAGVAWKACRDEVLKIINDNQIYIANPLRAGYVSETKTLVEKIKKL